MGVSVHTLRYYEKIGLLAPIQKTPAGRRRYSDQDVERLRFVKRAKKMQFSLEEIRRLVEMEKAEHVEKTQAQKMVHEKLEDIELRLKDLKLLKKDLSKMLNACLASGDEQDCPIIEGFKDTKL